MFSTILKYSVSIIFSLLFISCAVTLKKTTDMKDFEIGEVGIKPLIERTTEGYLWFSVKVSIKNKTEKVKNILVEVQGIDKEGFELKDFDLKGVFNPNEEKILTDRRFMPEEEFKNVVKWQVATIEDAE